MKKIWYHAHCMDGYTAAWVAQRVMGCGVVPVSYGKDPPAYGPDDEILIVDFSYGNEVLKKIQATVAGLVVLDHHKTADLTGIKGVFDTTKSGARLTWDYLKGGEAPRIVAYVEDRDLWNWALVDSQAINTWLGSLKQDLEIWDWAAMQLEEDFASCRREGLAILRYRDRLVERLAASVEKGKMGWGIVFSGCLESEIGEALKEQFEVVAIVRRMKEGNWGVSLRSKERDVSAIAVQFGGGGHKLAAGCTISDLGEIL